MPVVEPDLPRYDRPMQQIRAHLQDLGRLDLLDRPLADVFAGIRQRGAFYELEEHAKGAAWGTLGDLLANVGEVARPRVVRGLANALIAWIDEENGAAAGEALLSPAGGPVPGAPLDVWRAWARTAGVEPWLDAEAANLDVWQKDLRTLPVGALLARIPAKPHADVQVRAVQFLLQRAVEVRRAVDAERGRPVDPPADVVLGALWTRLADHRAALRARVSPIAIKPPRVRLDAAKDAVVVWIEARPRCCTAATATVTLTLPLTPAPEAPPMTCACGRPGPCPYGLAGLDGAMAALRGELGAEVAARLRRPAWATRIDRLDEALKPPPERDLAWQLTIDRSNVTIQPVDRHDRQWSIRWRDPAPTLTGMDRSLFALAQLGQPGSNPDGVVGAMLRMLIGHRAVLYNDAPVQVRAASLEVSLERVGASVKLVLREDGAVVAPDAVLRGARRIKGLGAITVAPGVVTVWDIDERLPDLIAHVVTFGDVFAPEALPSLLERLPVLKAFGLQRLSDELRGVQVPADPRPVVVLEATEDDLYVEIVVEPLARGARYPVGAGPIEVYRVERDVAYATREPLAEIAAAAEVVDRLELDDGGDPTQFLWVIDDPREIHGLLGRVAALGDLARVIWVTPPKKALRPLSARDLRVTVGTIDKWFAIGGEIRIDDLAIPLERLLDALRSGKRHVEAGGALLSLTEGYVAKLRALAGATDAGALSPLAATLVADLAADGATVDAVPAYRWAIDRMTAAATLDVTVPAGFAGELRDYQRDGYAFLARLAEWAPGALLCDDMGLGKTAQALALLLRRADRGPALVVAPMSVVSNWAREAARFAPSLKVHVHHGAARGRAAEAGPGDVLVTTWDLLVRDREALGKVAFATAVFDEAHAVKNPDALRTRAAVAVNAAFRVALTGTPLENRLSDLWSLASVAVPGLFGGWGRFRERFAGPIERDADPAARAALGQMIGPFLLRRRKGDVAKELPSRTEITVVVDPSPGEKALYDEARIAAVAALGSETPDAQRRFQVLAALTTLRQIACHPRLHRPTSKAPGAKLDRFRELLAEVVAEGHQALVFSQFTALLAIVREALAEDGVKVRYLDGSTPMKARESEVAAFQKGDGQVFLISLKAGGTGLNLTAATYVFHLDPWWNPAVEDQASDRAHRIGQTKPVTIYKLVTKGTVEEGILALQADKRALVEAVLAETGGRAPMSVDDLRELLAYGTVAVPDVARPGRRAFVPTIAATAGRSPTDLRAAADRMLAEPEWLGLRAQTASGYATVVRRIATFLAERSRAWTDEEHDVIVADYAAAIASGAFAAPKSDVTAARAALNKLRRAFAAEG